MNDHKIVVAGSGSVGKSLLTDQFVQSHFIETFNPTLALTDAYLRRVAIDVKEALLDILDTSTEENSTRIRRAQGFVLVYSIISRASFEEILQFRDLICRVKDSNNVPMILVGNKADLEEQRAVSADEGVALANSWGVPFSEASARGRVNVEEAFCNVMEQIRSEAIPPVNTTITPVQRKKKCCMSLSQCTII